MNKQMTRVFFKLVCEQVNVFEKVIEIDENFGDLLEIHNYLSNHTDMLTTDRTWIIYPMTMTIQ